MEPVAPSPPSTNSSLDERIHVNIELKDASRNSSRLLWEYIDHHRLHDRVLLAAQHDSIAKAMRVYHHGRVGDVGELKEIGEFWLNVLLRAHASKPVSFDALRVPRASWIARDFPVTSKPHTSKASRSTCGPSMSQARCGSSWNEKSMGS
ncbi:MAG: hypothetical protein R3A47_01375 [Polyangiales bacterium]